jgi:hypothetical protein
MSSSSSSSLMLTAALGTPPTQTLNRTNHLAWKALVLPAFCGARVMGLLDGSDRALPEIMEVEDDKGKRYRWKIWPMLHGLNEINWC